MNELIQENVFSYFWWGVEHEVPYEFPRVVHGLRSDAGRTAGDVGGRHGGDELLKLFHWNLKAISTIVEA